MKQMTISSTAEKRLKKGICLLEKKDFSHLSFDHQLVELINQKGQFVGTAYLSAQNKGIGWLISRQKITLDTSFFRTLFKEAKGKRQVYQDDQATTAYRLFNQDGDGFGGLTIDLYQDYALFSWYNSFVYDLRKEIVTAFRDIYPEVLGGYEKIRFRGADYESAHLYGEEAPHLFTILENGIQYQIFLNDGLMTGIFLDQHEVRKSLMTHLAAGKKVLNLFSYTAAFSVAAAIGGAAETVSVDLAKRSRELSQAHFKHNQIDLSHHQFLVMDVFAYFKYAKRHGLLFDVIVLDPPSFARNKKQTFSVAKDYHKLVAQSQVLLQNGGILIASTNAANVSREKFKKEIEKGLMGTRYSYLEEYGLPADFQYNKKDESSNYLKVFTIKVKK